MDSSQVKQILNKHAGQPTKIDNARVQLLIAAFQNGMDVRSACIYAGISKTAYYERCRKDIQFLDTMERAKNNLTELAGNRISTILRTGSDRDAGPIARWVLEKKIPDEYGNKTFIQQNNQQNNYFNLPHENLMALVEESGFDMSDPVKLFEDLETVVKEEENMKQNV